MKQFLLKNNYGNVILLVVLTVITLLLSSTLSLILLGLGVIGLDYTYDTFIGDRVYETALSLWTLIMIVVYIILTIYIWIELIIFVDVKYNTDEKKK